jgi:hypothetical protein
MLFSTLATIAPFFSVSARLVPFGIGLEGIPFLLAVASDSHFRR